MTTFQLGDRLTDEQRAFFDEHGYLHFRGFASRAEVARLNAGAERASDRLCTEKRRSVRGIPLRYGKSADGRAVVQRLAFTAQFSPEFAEFVTPERFAPVLDLIPGCRIGVEEKDGVVVNHWVNARGSRYRKLGWHTDGLRDVFLH